MQLKISSKSGLLILGIAGIVFSAGAVLFLNLDLPRPVISHVPQNLVAGVSSEQASPGLPVRLKIPQINVDAAIEHVGLTPQGDMDAPKGPDNAAWYNLGPRAGEKGSAVIDGHSGWYNGLPAVFDNLSKLQNGDKIYVEDDKGMIISFMVRESRSYDPGADASEVFGSKDGKAHLNLITCEGVWDKAAKSYSKRLVIFTDREME